MRATVMLTPALIESTVRAFRADLETHLAKSGQVSISGEVQLCREMLRGVSHRGDGVLPAKDETLMWGLALSAVVAVMIGQAVHGIGISKSDVN
ncbi:hypothetical protein ACQW08_06240 [Gluconobacter japonicus]|uniref:hypothetical protein n=1 Tax=Gluconobacter japonicus TaxID=376620 RepID=UPI003D2AA600